MLNKGSPARVFGLSAIITVIALVFAGTKLGSGILLTLITLIIIEISLSADSAIINADKLSKLSGFWQTIFLTVGIIIAVFGVRFIIPVAIVSEVTKLSWVEVVKLAFDNPAQYTQHLKSVYPIIASFGGSFLLTLALTYFCTEKRKNIWIKPIEKQLTKLNASYFPALVTLSIVVFLSLLPWGLKTHKMLIAGISGIVLFLLINWVSTKLEKLHQKHNKKNRYALTGFAAFISFMYLELLGDTFSLGSVVGAFAITDQVALIVIGLGIGAIWVRSLTIYFIRKGVDNQYPDLETAAHYIMLILALVLFSDQFFEYPHYLIAIIIVTILIFAIGTSPKKKSRISLSRH